MIFLNIPKGYREDESGLSLSKLEAGRGEIRVYRSSIDTSIDNLKLRLTKVMTLFSLSSTSTEKEELS